jgi:glutathione S-transferase
LHYEDYPPSLAVQRDIDRLSEIITACRSKAKDGAFLFGRFTVADAMYAPTMLRLVSYGIHTKLAKPVQDYIVCQSYKWFRSLCSCVYPEFYFE